MRHSLGHGEALAYLARHRIPVNLDSMEPDMGLIEVVVSGHRSVQRQLGLSVHHYAFPLPAASLKRVRPVLDFGDDVYVASPTLTLRIASRRADLPSLLLLALEQCGTYITDPEGYRPTVFELDSQASVQDLSRGLDAMELAERAAPEFGDRRCRSRGLGLCRQVISYCADASASPMESRLFSYLRLPRRLGGFGMAPPELNGTIDLDVEQQLVMDASELRIDLLWRRQRIGVEYESDQWHVSDVSPERVRRDKRRLSAAKLCGFDLLPLTTDITMSQVRLDAFVELLCAKLGKRLRAVGATSMRHHRELYGSLFRAR